MIGAIGVAVPARDEGPGIGGCIASIADAVAATTVPAVVVVAADSCRDDTVETARRVGDRRDLDLEVVACRCGSAGLARKHAVGHLVELLTITGVTPASTWIACTDADTTVPTDWLDRQLAWAARGFDAVAGLVDLPPDAPPELRAAFHDAVRAVGSRYGHSHVHAANLGIRLSALVAVGGFPDVEIGEDHALWDRLARSPARILGATDTTVVTSARLVGRTTGGFAAFLTELKDGLAERR
jgi:glycosyltransferase involved in cell wall biosynthesis